MPQSDAARIDEQGCAPIKRRLEDSLRIPVDVAFFAGEKPLCESQGNGQPLFEKAAIHRLRARLQAGENPAFTTLREGTPSLLYGAIFHSAQSAKIMMVIGLPALGALFPFPPDGSLHPTGAALMNLDGDPAAYWGTRPTSWLPQNLAEMLNRTGSGFADLSSVDGSRYRYFLAPLQAVGGVLIVAYPATVFMPWNGQFLEIAAAFILLFSAAIIGVIWSLDHLLMRWIIYLRRIVTAHARGRWSVRASRLAEAPSEIRELGESINFMAEHMSEHAARLETALNEKASLLRELHHRVKNNFQVIVSLLSLHKKGLPPERWNETRFLEEHIRAMAIAYRASYAAGSPKGVGPIQLITDITDALCETAGIRPGCVRILADPDSKEIDLDKAIELGLYFAYFLPPYLTRETNTRRPVTIALSMTTGELIIALSNLTKPEIAQSALRQRLADAYGRQLGAFVQVPSDPTELVIRIALAQERAEAA